MSIPASRTSGASSGERATSPVVGVVVLVGVTVVLAATGVAFMTFGQALDRPGPRATIDARLTATDGYADGQRLTLTHGGGETLAVADLTVVVEIPRLDASARLVGLPARRLTGEHVRGRDVFDGTYAGIEGPLDAVHTDGEWRSGERASIRIAQEDLNLRPGDRLGVRVVHRPTGTTVDGTTVVAE